MKSFLVAQGERELQELSAVGYCLAPAGALQSSVAFVFAAGLWLVPWQHRAVLASLRADTRLQHAVCLQRDRR